MYRTAAPLPPEPPREWQLIVEAFLYEHLSVPEAWLARAGGTVALLVGARMLAPEHHGENRAWLFGDLRRMEGQRPPLLAPASFGLERVCAPGETEALPRHVAVCPWPDAAGMTLAGIARHLPGSRFEIGAAVEVAAQLARVRLAAPHASFTYARVIVFESGEVRVAPPLPETERSAALSDSGFEYLDDLGIRGSKLHHPNDREAAVGVASALFELVAGFGEAGGVAKRQFLHAAVTAQPAHPLPSDFGVRSREVDALVARGTSGDASLPELAQALAALSQALDGPGALGRAVRASVAAAAPSPPHRQTWDGKRIYMLFPDVQALPVGAGWPGIEP
ncbi:hypothetical protein WMF45_29840 [Sorangium sp. So ce448]|uniref:hypothetical protein n=1 Tax=Sorangium sp. So ce448 TaxID=3133314 RepID=UPI003F622D6F